MTVRTKSPATAIKLGSTGGPTVGTLDLSDAELDRITAGTIAIGDGTFPSTITVSGAINHLGDASFLVTTGRNIVFTSVANWNSTDGDLAFEANSAGATAGNFAGIEFSSAIVQVTGAGNLSLLGRGGNAAGLQRGISLKSGTIVRGGSSGTVMLSGTGGQVAGGSNHGVVLDTGSAITSTGANVLVSGNGGAGSGFGVYVDSNGRITAGGMGAVTVVGSGGNFSTGGSYGVMVRDPGSAITSSGGSVQVTGTGGSTAIAAGLRGVAIEAGGTVSAGGNGAVTVTGTGGNGPGGSNYGIFVVLSGSAITSGGGPVLVTGTGGGSVRAATTMACW